jgi:hypothetical protein
VPCPFAACVPHSFATACLGLLVLAGQTQAQFTANDQTNTIDGVVSNWPGDYVVGSNTFNDALQILNGGVLSNGAG